MSIRTSQDRPGTRADLSAYPLGGESTSCKASAYVLVGPTAAGKTAVAQWIGEDRGWPVLSADSMLVYRGMDIGTAKPSRDEMRRVRYWGVDVTTPECPFSVADYLEEARRCVAEVGGGNPLIVVGGTGLYLRALLEGLASGAGPSLTIRQHWQAVLEAEGVSGLQKALQSRSPAWYEALSDKSNPRRLTRALERWEAGEQAPQRTWVAGSGGRVVAGLAMNRDRLKERIANRVDAMYDHGLLEEVDVLLKQYGRLSATAGQAIGYKEACSCLYGEMLADKARELTVTRTCQLAKRQMTWFRGQMAVEWVETEERQDVRVIASRVLAIWERTGAVPLAI